MFGGYFIQIVGDVCFGASGNKVSVFVLGIVVVVG